MSLHPWFRPPRHLLGLFLAITMALAAALGWLGWRLLAQERALETQRLQERLEPAAELAVNALQRSSSAIQELLASLIALPESQVASAAAQAARSLAGDALLAILKAEGLEAYPPDRLLYYPSVVGSGEASQSVFDAGETAEFQQRDHAKAIVAFRELALSQDPAIRAGALLRLGRALRKTGQIGAALAAYEELARSAQVRIAGAPAELLARHARCLLLEQTKRLPELEQEARGFYSGLQAGRWHLDRATYMFHIEEARRWIPAPADTEAGFEVLAAAVETLWEDWQRNRDREPENLAGRSLWVQDRPVLLIRRNAPGRAVALVAGPGFVEREWIGGLQELLKRQGMRLALSDAEGRHVQAPLPAAAKPQVVRAASDTKLPWTVYAAIVDAGFESGRFSVRRRLLLAGLALMVLVVLAASYFIGRAVTRELEVARLQSEFVAVVSHEFRTPLTSLRQFTELLARDRVPTEERRQRYYQVLERGTARLHRIVEGLLNFARIEAGAQQYRFEPIDPAQFARGVVAEFQAEVASEGYLVEISANGDLPRVRADQEALGRALWNLLDNAVKYSPACRTVWVDLAREGERVAIRVRDRGMGIPPSERKRIFQKFVRGAGPNASRVKGTGIGLALVQHIARAHGGEITLDSQPGIGSTFTLRLPPATLGEKR